MGGRADFVVRVAIQAIWVRGNTKQLKPNSHAQLSRGRWFSFVFLLRAIRLALWVSDQLYYDDTSKAR